MCFQHRYNSLPHFKNYNKSAADDIVAKLLKLFEITQVDKVTILEALQSGFYDFEDSIIYASAYLNQIDYILTQDKKGFQNSKVKILSPIEFAAKLVS